jgi:glycosyltransferase involved in cell wall biosynthesis
MVSLPNAEVDPAGGKYIAYAGRFSVEKGIDILLEAARKSPELPVSLAGDGPIMPQLVAKAPENARFVGALHRAELAGFYRKARFLVVPSLCFESGSLVTAEAMSHGLPVIASRIGGLPEMVEDGVTGLLFEPGDAEDLAGKMKLLWEGSRLCRKMGRAGREKAMRQYNGDLFYKRLIAVYEKAIEVGKEKR